MTTFAEWESLPNDLAAFATQLERVGVESAERTAHALQLLHGAFDNDWRARRRIRADTAIPVPVPRDKALFPIGCELTDASIRFEFQLGDDLEALPTRAEFQVCVGGHVEYQHCIINLQDHWRVDTHDFIGTPREPHPYIHFQRGGHAQDEWAGSIDFIPGPSLPTKDADYWRSLLQSPGPRIPFPPVCPVLAIDFVIGQHDGDVWRRLRNERDYRDIIAKAQTRIWTPFFEGLADAKRRREWLGAMLI